MDNEHQKRTRLPESMDIIIDHSTNWQCECRKVRLFQHGRLLAKMRLNTFRAAVAEFLKTMGNKR